MTSQPTEDERESWEVPISETRHWSPTLHAKLAPSKHNQKRDNCSTLFAWIARKLPHQNQQISLSPLDCPTSSPISYSRTDYLLFSMSRGGIFVPVIFICFLLCTLFSPSHSSCYDTWSRCSKWSSGLTGILWSSCDKHCKERGKRSGTCVKVKSTCFLSKYALQCQCRSWGPVLTRTIGASLEETLFCQEAKWCFGSRHQSICRHVSYSFVLFASLFRTSLQSRIEMKSMKIKFYCRIIKGCYRRMKLLNN